MDVDWDNAPVLRIPPDEFDRLMKKLDEPAERNEKLAALFARPRQFEWVDEA